MLSRPSIFLHFPKVSFFAPDPSWADWESREVLPWREACQEEPTEDFSLNVALAGRVIQIRISGVKRKVRRLLAHFLTTEPPDEVLALPDAWDPEHYRQHLRDRLAAHLIAHDILPIYARTVVIHRPALHGSPALSVPGGTVAEQAPDETQPQGQLSIINSPLGPQGRLPEQELSINRTALLERDEPRALLLIGEKKHEAAFRLHHRLRPRARVLMGSVQALEISHGHLKTHATPFTDRYPWEENPSAPGSAAASPGIGEQSVAAPNYASAQITRILLLPSDVTFLSSESFNIDSLFAEDTSADILPSLIQSLVLPEGLQLRLKSLSLAGKISEAFK